MHYQHQFQNEQIINTSLHRLIVKIEGDNILWTVKHDWDMDCDDNESVYHNGWIILWNTERSMEWDI